MSLNKKKNVVKTKSNMKASHYVVGADGALTPLNIPGESDEETKKRLLWEWDGDADAMGQYMQDVFGLTAARSVSEKRIYCVEFISGNERLMTPKDTITLTAMMSRDPKPLIRRLAREAIDVASARFVRALDLMGDPDQLSNNTGDDSDDAGT